MGRTRRSLEIRSATFSAERTRHTSTIVAAYLETEQTHTVRNLVWRLTALVAAAACVLSLSTSVLNRTDWAFGGVLFGGAAIVVAIVEVRARLRLEALTADLTR